MQNSVKRHTIRSHGTSEKQRLLFSYYKKNEGIVSIPQWILYELLDYIYFSIYWFLFLPRLHPSLAQIETIGDAYCVAGGLHKKVDSHAKPIAHMALKMMELSEEVLTPDGKPIKVSLNSLHSNQCTRRFKGTGGVNVHRTSYGTKGKFCVPLMIPKIIKAACRPLWRKHNHMKNRVRLAGVSVFDIRVIL